MLFHSFDKPYLSFLCQFLPFIYVTILTFQSLNNKIWITVSWSEFRCLAYGILPEDEARKLVKRRDKMGLETKNKKNSPVPAKKSVSKTVGKKRKSSGSRNYDEGGDDIGKFLRIAIIFFDLCSSAPQLLNSLCSSPLLFYSPTPLLLSSSPPLLLSSCPLLKLLPPLKPLPLLKPHLML